MLDEDLENSPRVMLLELSYLDENDEVCDLTEHKCRRSEEHHGASFSMAVPDSLDMGAYKKVATGTPPYELFAVLVLDPSCLSTCLQYAAVKKRTNNEEYQWYLFKQDEYIKISKEQIFS